MRPQNSCDWPKMFSILSWNGPEIQVFSRKEVSTFENLSITPSVKMAIIFGSELPLSFMAVKCDSLWHQPITAGWAVLKDELGWNNTWLTLDHYFQKHFDNRWNVLFWVVQSDFSCSSFVEKYQFGIRFQHQKVSFQKEIQKSQEIHLIPCFQGNTMSYI